MVFERIYWPAGFLITFSTYGTRLHGRSEGSVDRRHNQFGAPVLPEDGLRHNIIRKNMHQNEITLDENQRNIVLNAIIDICKQRDWELYAAHVRTEHLHVLVSGKSEPEIIMTAMKAKATQSLRKSYPEMKPLKIWTRHGSTKYIWESENLSAAVRYVVKEQGEPMALHYSSDRFSQ